MTSQQPDSYQQAYSDGVMATVDALFEDFNYQGEMTSIRRDETGGWGTMLHAELRSRGYHNVARIFERALGMPENPGDTRGLGPR
jgi:hypothetical protein